MDVAIVERRVDAYSGAAERVLGTLDALAAPTVVAASEELPADPASGDPSIQPFTDLESAVDGLIESGRSVERALLADPHDPAAVVRLSALTAADLSVLAAIVDLVDLDEASTGPEAAEYVADVAVTASVRECIGGVRGVSPLGGIEAAVVVGEGPPGERVGAAVDAMVADAAGRIGAVTAAAVWPTGDDVVGLVGRIFGSGPADLLGEVFGQISRWKAMLLGAAKKLIAAIIDRLSRLFGKVVTGAILERIKQWISDLLAKVDVLGVVLGVDSLKAECVDALGAAPDADERAEAVDGVAAAHADAQEWIGRGVWVIRVGKFAKIHTMAPAGPVLMGVLAAGLVLASGWLVNDHLDARSLPLPDLTTGVRTICAFEGAGAAQ